MKATVEVGVDKLIQVREKQKEEDQRLTDAMDYAKVVARNLTKVHKDNEPTLRHAIDRLIFEATMGMMDNCYNLTGIRPSTGQPTTNVPPTTAYDQPMTAYDRPMTSQYMSPSTSRPTSSVNYGIQANPEDTEYDYYAL